MRLLPSVRTSMEPLLDTKCQCPPVSFRSSRLPLAHGLLQNLLISTLTVLLPSTKALTKSQAPNNPISLADQVLRHTLMRSSKTFNACKCHHRRHLPTLALLPQVPQVDKLIQMKNVLGDLVEEDLLQLSQTQNRAFQLQWPLQQCNTLGILPLRMIHEKNPSA